MGNFTWMRDLLFNLLRLASAHVRMTMFQKVFVSNQVVTIVLSRPCVTVPVYNISSKLNIPFIDFLFFFSPFFVRSCEAQIAHACVGSAREVTLENLI